MLYNISTQYWILRKVLTFFKNYVSYISLSLLFIFRGLVSVVRINAFDQCAYVVVDAYNLAFCANIGRDRINTH